MRRVAVNANGPGRRLGQGLHQWSPAERERFPARLGFDRGLSLVDARVWSVSVSLNDVWGTTSRGNRGMEVMFVAAPAIWRTPMWN